MAENVGSVLITDVPTSRIAMTVHRAVREKPTWMDRKFKYAMLVGLGERWSSERLAPGDQRRQDYDNPAPWYDLVDATGGQTIHIVYREAENETRAVFIGLGFDKYSVGRIWAEKFAHRVAEFLAEDRIGARVEDVEF
ncbi:hypothetical protein [Nocardia shimofusensis]|uniref:hypothetical protein n=1 Tax=Nocardia shimofusensis TaxID=228596 RepID=UPI0008324E84|nr:hypothetical protein [Nocardia shimofusensis]